jgi:hypothetical protein
MESRHIFPVSGSGAVSLAVGVGIVLSGDRCPDIGWAASTIGSCMGAIGGCSGVSS